MVKHFRHAAQDLINGPEPVHSLDLLGRFSKELE